MKRSTFLSMMALLVFSLFALLACGEDEEPNTCIDESLINPLVVCSTLLNPVCGCDNNTYTNSCFATQEGVSRWTEGTCESQ